MLVFPPRPHPLGPDESKPVQPPPDAKQRFPAKELTEAKEVPRPRSKRAAQEQQSAEPAATVKGDVADGQREIHKRPLENPNPSNGMELLGRRGEAESPHRNIYMLFSARQGSRHLKNV